MNYKMRLGLLILIDSMIVMFSIVIGNWLLAPVAAITTGGIIATSIALLVSHHVFGHFFKLYKRVWQYASIRELSSIFASVTLSIATVAVFQLAAFQAVYSRTLLVTWMLHILFIGASRFSWRVFRDAKFKTDRSKKRTLIIGAGNGGMIVARQLISSEMSELRPVAFIDDDTNKQQLEIMGVPVIGCSEEIQEVVKAKEVEHIIIAIPSLSKKELNDIFEKCAETKVRTQIMPSIEDIMSGRVNVTEMRDVQVEDLLGRDPVELETQKIEKKLTRKTVMVTGAGGVHRLRSMPADRPLFPG